MAASSSAVSVLTPNGRRQTVKVSPNTPLLQVLEDVCKKHGFNPDEHGLKFQRNVLDLSLQWRFASLPNNAKLEMVACSRPQMGAESATLWDLLTHFPQTRTSDLDASGPTPVCVYMRDEVSGEDALKKTTLKSLGLTGGSAIIRYVLKGSSSSCPAASVDAVTAPTDAVAKTTVSQPPPEPPVEPAPIPMETPPPPTEVVAPVNHHPVKQEEEEPNASREQAVRPKTRAAGDQPQQSKLMPQEDDEQPGTSKQCQGSAPSATPTNFVPFSGSGQRLGGTGTAGLKTSTSWSSYRSVSAKQASKDEEETDEYLEPVDRDPLVFHLDAGARHHDDQELPDEFFEVTVDDIRKRFAQLKSERKALEEAPLMTKSLRESQMKEKLDRYPKVALRVQFPDRHILQGFFRPLETGESLPCCSGVLWLRHAYLRSDLLDTSVSALQADELIAGCMPRSPPPVSSHAPADDHLPPAPESCDSSGQRGETEDGCDAQTPAVRPVRTDPAKVPKWLKLPAVHRVNDVQLRRRFDEGRAEHLLSRAGEPTLAFNPQNTALHPQPRACTGESHLH
ncbi:Tether containing UBX domain for GLUT4 [Labeo rohita]|uniref:Tether containing UBX domain for GLUT4 n=1 Tax=Labeo rohita TaxID=84645 RepID=A0ABQ8M7S2_LABRO|nr:Tether containing UBX domain for GLUT4 [Labeo rohita]